MVYFYELAMDWENPYRVIVIKVIQIIQ